MGKRKIYGHRGGARDYVLHEAFLSSLLYLRCRVGVAVRFIFTVFRVAVVGFILNNICFF